MQYEPVGLKFYVEEILAYLGDFITHCPAQHDLFLDMRGPEIVLSLCSRLPWEDGDLAMSIIHRLILSGGRALEELPTSALVRGLASIYGGYLHYEKLRRESAEAGVVFPTVKLTTLALPLDITWHTLQYAPAPVFDSFAAAAESAGLPAMMGRLAAMPELTPGMKERVRQIEYMFASVRGMWGKVSGKVGNIVGAL